ncbi:hypothetical protein BDV93DRAFT_95535 [Ceratobasidium sp. AG-I]|nr:hypothetical protein BDV93DRAFT_95535 [Ceratobasidium sp. AG-I]
MVSSQIPDTVRTPAQVIQSLWKSSRDSAPEQDLSKLIDDFPQIVGNHFQSLLNSENGLKEIYTLPRNHPLGAHPAHSLIRMRLMVQDNSISPDIYLAQQPDGLPGGWAMEQPQAPPTGEGQTHPTITLDDVDYSKLRERHVLWAVQVPGESTWPSQLLDLSDEIIEDSNKSPEIQKVDAYTHKSPNDEPGFQIKIYGEVPKLSPADVATFVGIFDHEPYAGSQLPDAPLAPTLHVVYWHRNPTALLQASHFSEPSASVSSVPGDWQSLVGWISESLGGDLDAAEWVALCMASDCDTRLPNNLPVSLTLTGFPQPETPDSVPNIARLLEQLLPLVSHIPLTLDTLNTKSMSPYSEASNEDLHAGLLQLPLGSVVIFDERIEEGKLGERGMENARVIQDVLMKQSLAYRFPYSSFDFKTNITSIVLTEGKREALFAKVRFNLFSFLRCAFCIES